jgi:hypothetical protein
VASKNEPSARGPLLIPLGVEYCSYRFVPAHCKNVAIPTTTDLLSYPVAVSCLSTTTTQCSPSADVCSLMKRKTVKPTKAPKAKKKKQHPQTLTLSLWSR